VNVHAQVLRGGGAMSARDGGSGGGTLPLPPAWAITAVLGLAYVIAAPPSSDLAAASYRSDLFSRVGFTLWDNSWYGGHHLLAYSLLAPALGALIGPQLVAALSMTAATALFSALLHRRFTARAAGTATAVFALGASIELLSNRVPFDLGLAIALGALLLAERGRPAFALAVAVLSSLASPVAGAFLALAFLAWALAGPERAWPAALTLAALVPIGALELAFPEGGTQPFAGSAFYPAFAGALAIAVLMPRDQRALRVGTLLYALAMAGAFLLPTAVGGNADRLGALLGAPLVACLLIGGSAIGRRPRLLLALAPLLLYWQANASTSDFIAALKDPAVNASYYAPLLGELTALGVGYGSPPTRPARIEVVATTDHWEGRWLAPHVMLARGWERQLDRLHNSLFYEESTPLSAARYHAWLSQNAISYVALPDAPLDYSAKSEARLLTTGEPRYLHEIWRSAHWRLFAVLGASPLASAPGVLESVTSDSFTLYAPRPGAYTVRVHFTSYWALAGGSGCVSRAPGDWTELRARRASDLYVVIRFSLARVFGDGSRCA
jgi:hypothetical protein